MNNVFDWANDGIINDVISDGEFVLIREDLLIKKGGFQ